MYSERRQNKNEFVKYWRILKLLHVPIVSTSTEVTSTSSFNRKNNFKFTGYI